MDDFSGVNVLEGFEDLVDKVLEMLIRQDILGVDNFVQISLHEVENHVAEKWNTGSAGAQRARMLTCLRTRSFERDE
jgi:hypothetical protein